MTLSISPILTFVSQHQNEFISFGLTLLGGLIVFLLRSRVKLQWGQANNAFFRVAPNPSPPQQNSTQPQLPPQPIALYSEKYYLKNNGRVPAKNVDVTFASKPDAISVWQDRKYEESTASNGTAYIVTIPYIAPFELVIIDSLWVNRNHGSITSVRCADALGKQVEFWVNRNYGTAINLIIFLLLVIGVFYLVNLFVGFVLG
ncbi:MAG: hypothetical protein AB7O79_06240 [Xanthobacteraceae bacterium]